MKTDNEVWALLIMAIDTSLTAMGLPATVIQSFQPTQQGVEVTPVVALHSIDSKRYGWPEDCSYYDEQTDTIVRRKSYWLERTYQVNALAIQNPATPSAPTAFDYIDAVSAILQTMDTQEFLFANGIGILRIQPLRVAYFVDDKGRHEQVPSFDFTLTYQQVQLAAALPITSITGEIYEV